MRDLSFWLLVPPLAAQALRIPFSSIKPWETSSGQSQRMQMLLASQPGSCSDSICGQLSNLLDVVYFSNITVGGQQYLVQLDTGSSDLWVNATLQPAPQATVLQNVVVSNVYGDGSNYTGPVAFGDVQFHGYEVKNQSFTYALQSENDNTAQLNLTGLIGLSFDSISNNDQAVRQSTGSATLGQTFLSNVFAANSSLEPFISFILSREADINATANSAGAFTIAEIEKGYEAIENSKAVSLFEVSQSVLQWTVPIDSFAIAGKSVQTGSTVRGANNVIALLDTGTSAMLIPDALAQEIYGSMPGVQSFSQQGQTTYLIPCDQAPPQVDIAIGGQTVTIHPLDSNVIFQTFQSSSGLVSLCGGGIIGYTPDSNIVGSGFDLLLGDTFLRNSYTMFNFNSSPSSSSSSSGSPFIKILGITDPSAAASDFTATRKQQLSLAPAASSTQIQAILNGDPDFVPVDTPPLTPGGGNGNGNGGSGPGGTGHGAAASVNVGSSVFVAAFLGTLALVFS